MTHFLATSSNKKCNVSDRARCVTWYQILWYHPPLLFGVSVVTLWLFLVSITFFFFYSPTCALLSCLFKKIFFYVFLFLSPHSSLGQPSLLKEGSLSNIVVPEKKISATCTPTGIRSSPTVQPSSQDKPITLEVLTPVPPPQRLSDAEVPLWKALEGRSGQDTPEKTSAKEGTKPLCRG